MKGQASTDEISLVEILKNRLKHAEEICELTASQKEAIEAEDWPGVEDILDKKDIQIRSFREAEEQLRPWKGEGDRLQETATLRDLLAQTEERLRAIQTLEDACVASLIGKKDEVGKTLKGIQRVRQGIRSFKPIHLLGPRFVNLRK